MNHAIQMQGLTRRFGATVALDGIDLDVGFGSVTGLLGHNGAGKTTAVRLLATLLRPSAGRALVCGLDVVGDAAQVRGRIALAGQHATLDELLTGRENLRLLGGLLGLSRRAARARAAELLDRFDLVTAADRTVATYSGGMRRRLDLAACLIVPRPVALLDEPSTGLDPVSRLEVWEAIRELVDDGTAVVLTSQYLDEVDRLADRVVVLSAGRIVADGTPGEMKDSVGGRRIEATVAPAELDAAEAALAAAGLEPAIERRRHTVSAAAPRGSADLEDALTALGAARIDVAEAGLRRPTLDDAFLALAGETAEEVAA